MKRQMGIDVFGELLLSDLLVAINYTQTYPEQNDAVVMLGDSIFALSNDEAAFLETYSGQQYRKYYVSGAQMVGGVVTPVPEQYEQAKRADANIRTVIFDGGGNDVLSAALSKCGTDSIASVGEMCRTIFIKAIEAAWVMAEQMLADGVENIIWQGYYWVAFEPLWPALIESSKMIQAGMAQFIEIHKQRYPNMKFIYVDPLSCFDKAEAAADTIADGIHPTEATSKRLAALLWETMAANNIEQRMPCDSNSALVPTMASVAGGGFM